MFSFISAPSRLRLNMSNVCYFKLKMSRSQVLSANFSFYVRPPANQNHNGHERTTYLQLYKLGPPIAEGFPPTEQIIRNKKFNLNTLNPGWITFKIRNVLQSWISDPRSNYGLRVDFFDHNGNSLVITPSPSNTEHDDLYVS